MRWKKSTLIGQVFGMLTVIDLVDSFNHNRQWKCICQCGNERIVPTAFLNNKTITHCGCNKKEREQLKKDNLVGKTFNKLTVIKDSGKRKAGVLWLCNCNCGGTILVSTHSLTHNYVRSCGCLRSGWSDKSTRLKPGEAVRNSIIATYKANAKLNNREYSLTIEETELLFKGDCFYCGDKPSRIRTRRTSSNSYTYNGIDRVDNKIGYTVDNCVSCCTQCNLRKSSASKDEFLTWIKKIALIHK